MYKMKYILSDIKWYVRLKNEKGKLNLFVLPFFIEKDKKGIKPFINNQVKLIISKNKNIIDTIEEIHFVDDILDACDLILFCEGKLRRHLVRPQYNDEVRKISSYVDFSISKNKIKKILKYVDFSAEFNNKQIHKLTKLYSTLKKNELLDIVLYSKLHKSTELEK